MAQASGLFRPLIPLHLFLERPTHLFTFEEYVKICFGILSSTFSIKVLANYFYFLQSFYLQEEFLIRFLNLDL